MAAAAVGSVPAFGRAVATVEAGPDLEARARAARYAVLPSGRVDRPHRRRPGRDVLLNLLRGAGLDGLRAWTSRTGRCSRCAGRETRALCAALGLTWSTIPANVDPSIRRNRVRHELLAAARCDRRARRRARARAPGAVARRRGGRCSTGLPARSIRPTPTLAVAPGPLARRAVRAMAAMRERCRAPSPRRGHGRAGTGASREARRRERDVGGGGVSRAHRAAWCSRYGLQTA